MKIVKSNELDLVTEENIFFNNIDFINHLLIQKKQKYFFIIDNNKKEKDIIISSFCLNENKILLPPSGSFSYFYINKIEQDQNKLLEYLELIINFGYEIGVDEISFITSPTFLNTQYSLQNNALFYKNFQIKNSELGFVFNLNTMSDSKFSKTKAKFLRRLEKDKNYFGIENKRFLKEIFKCIKDSRTNSGYPLTMSYEDIKLLLDNCPNDIFLFSVRNIFGDIIAGSVTIKVSKYILYVFYWGELSEFRSKSPVLMLAKGMLDFCKLNKFKFLDLGISTFNSIPNKGLMQFKREIGADLYSKNQFIYKIN